jgi:phosphomannomutase
LIGDWAWAQYKAANPGVDPSKCVVLNSTVSSKMLQALAKSEGLHYEDTLTGFKWIGGRAWSLVQEGKTLIFGFEEAIGYMVGDVCWDKDGVRGASVFAEMASYYHAHGHSVYDRLQQLYAKLGFFASNNRYFFCYEPEKLSKIFGEMRNGGKYTDTCGRFKIKQIRGMLTDDINTRKKS